MADFTVDKKYAKVGQTITFTNTSVGAVSYSWDFGDGNTSTATNPTHSYSSKAKYTVTLTATDAGSNTTQKTMEIMCTVIDKAPDVFYKFEDNVTNTITGADAYSSQLYSVSGLSENYDVDSKLGSKSLDITGRMFSSGPTPPWSLGTSHFPKEVRNDWSMSFWAKPTSTHQIDSIGGVGSDGLAKYIVYPFNATSYGYSAGISMGTNGVSVYEHGSGYFPCRVAYDATASPLTAWTHVVLTLTGGDYVLYVNGTQVAVGTTGQANMLRSDALGTTGPYGGYNGLIDEYVCFTEALSSADVTALYNSGAGYDLIEAVYSGGGGGGGSVDGIVAMSLGDGDDVIIQIGKMDIS